MLGSVMPGSCTSRLAVVSSDVSTTRSRGCAAPIAASLRSWWCAGSFAVVRMHVSSAIVCRVLWRGHVVPVPGYAGRTRHMLFILPDWFFAISVAARVCLLLAGGIVFAIAFPMLAWLDPVLDTASRSRGGGLSFFGSLSALLWMSAPLGMLG